MLSKYPGARLATGLALSGALLLEGTACGMMDPVNRADVVVYPLTVSGENFAPVGLSADELEQRVRAGISSFNAASHNKLGALTVAATKPIELTVPGLRKADDLCNDGLASAFFDAAGKKIKNKEAVSIFVVNFRQEPADCIPGGAELGTRTLAIFRERSLEEDVIEHEFGHTVGLEHNDTWQCPKPRLVDTSCTSIPYGDWTKIMGVEAKGTVNSEPFTASQRVQLQNIGQDKIVTIDGKLPKNSAHTYVLSRPSVADDKLKAIRINTTAIGTPQSEEALRCLSSAIIQVDAETHTNANQQITETPVIKAYTQPYGYAAKPKETLVQLGNNTSEYGWASLAPITVVIGKLTLNLAFQKASEDHPGAVGDAMQITISTSFKGQPGQDICNPAPANS